MSYSREDIERILDTIDPMDVLTFCNIQPISISPKDIRAGCPIHKGTDPNFSLYYDSNHGKWRYKCFSHNCEQKSFYGNDLIALVRNCLNFNFKETVVTLANLAGVELKEEDDDVVSKFERDYIKNYNKEKYFLTKHKLDVLPTIKVTNKFKKGWGFVQKYLESPARNSNLEQISEFQLYPGIDYDNHLRLYIPIHDEEGRLVAITGRQMEGVLDYPPVERKNGRMKPSPKYDNVYGSKKSYVLYNLHRAKKYTDKSLIVVEGQFDAIRMHNCGYPNVVAKMGSVLSDRQVALLYKYSTSVILLIEDCNKIDSVTGKVLSLESRDTDLEKLKYGMKVSVAYLENDPDSSSKEEIDYSIKHAQLIKNI